MDNNDLDKVELKAQKKSERKEEFKEWLFFQKKELVKNFNIVKQLVIRSVKVQYRNSVIGVFWTVLNPLLNMLVMFIVFRFMFGRGGMVTATEQETYALYLLCGNIVFGMMRTATYQALPSIVQNRGLLTKNKMSYNVFPLACALSAVVNFLFSFIALLGVMLFSWIVLDQAVFSFNVFLVFVALPALFLFCYGISLVLSALYVFFRDIMHFYNVFLTLWMYLTPIFYSARIFEQKANEGNALGSMMETVVNLNPMYHFVEYFRDVVYRCSAHEAAIPNVSAQLAAATTPHDVATLTAELDATIAAAQLPGFDQVLILYAIGFGAILIGATVFMATKRKFIYSI